MPLRHFIFAACLALGAAADGNCEDEAFYQDGEETGMLQIRGSEVGKPPTPPCAHYDDYDSDYDLCAFCYSSNTTKLPASEVKIACSLYPDHVYYQPLAKGCVAGDS